MDHKEKKKLAKKLLSQREKKLGISPFSSLLWGDLKERIQTEVLRKETKAKERAKLRKEKIK